MAHRLQSASEMYDALKCTFLDQHGHKFIEQIKAYISEVKETITNKEFPRQMSEEAVQHAINFFTQQLPVVQAGALKPSNLANIDCASYGDMKNDIAGLKKDIFSIKMALEERKELDKMVRLERSKNVKQRKKQRRLELEVQGMESRHLQALHTVGKQISTVQNFIKTHYQVRRAVPDPSLQATGGGKPNSEPTPGEGSAGKNSMLRSARDDDRSTRDDDRSTRDDDRSTRDDDRSTRDDDRSTRDDDRSTRDNDTVVEHTAWQIKQSTVPKEVVVVKSVSANAFKTAEKSEMLNSPKETKKSVPVASKAGSRSPGPGGATANLMPNPGTAAKNTLLQPNSDADSVAEKNLKQNKISIDVKSLMKVVRSAAASSSKAAQKSKTAKPSKETKKSPPAAQPPEEGSPVSPTPGVSGATAQQLTHSQRGEVNSISLGADDTTASEKFGYQRLYLRNTIKSQSGAKSHVTSIEFFSNELLIVADHDVRSSLSIHDFQGNCFGTFFKERRRIEMAVLKTGEEIVVGCGTKIHLISLMWNQFTASFQVGSEKIIYVAAEFDIDSIASVNSSTFLAAEHLRVLIMDVSGIICGTIDLGAPVIDMCYTTDGGLVVCDSEGIYKKCLKTGNYLIEKVSQIASACSVAGYVEGHFFVYDSQAGMLYLLGPRGENIDRNWFLPTFIGKGKRPVHVATGENQFVCTTEFLATTNFAVWYEKKNEDEDFIFIPIV